MVNNIASGGDFWRETWMLGRTMQMLVVTVIGVLTAVPAQAQSGQLEKVTVATSGRAVTSYLPLTIADRLGYFKQEGLEVEILDFAGGSKSVEALLGGSVDLMTGSYEHTLLLQRRGAFPQALVLLTRSYGGVIALRKDKAEAYKSPKDLKGMIFGVSAPGSAMALALRIFLKKNGVSPDDVPIISVGQGAGAVAAIKSKKIDGIANPDPVITRLQNDGDVVVLADTRTEQGVIDLYGGLIAASAITVMPKFIKERPKETQGFVNAIVRALSWMKSASIDEIVDTVPSDFYGKEKGVYRQTVAAFKENFSIDGRITQELEQNTLKVARLGALGPTQSVDLAATYSDKFVEKAHASLEKSR
jgi:NitT/TauT family transport system substrate-binding protein